MIFETPWKTYKESETDRHEGNLASDPVIYIAHDRNCVWTRQTGAKEAHLATAGEISTLWDRYRLITLLSVLRVVNSDIPYAASEQL